MSVPFAFVTILVVWSTTPLSIHWSNETLSPSAAISARMALAALIGWLVLKAARIALPWHGLAVRTYAYSLLGVFGAMSLTYFGAKFIPSGLISILYALTPVVTNLVAALVFGRGDFSRLGWVSFAVSFLGVIVICSDGLVMQDKGWIGVLMQLLAVVLYAVSGILVQRETYQAHPLVITVGALILSLPLFLLLWWTTDGHLPQINWSSHSPWAVLYLAVFGSLIGFMAYFYIVKTRGATVVSMVTLATPMFALYLGHHFNGEQVSMQLVIGSIMVLSGLCVYFLSLNKSEPEALMPTEIEQEQRV